MKFHSGQWRRIRLQSAEPCRVPKHQTWAPPVAPQSSEPRVAHRFAQLRTVRAHDEGVMQKQRLADPAEQACEHQLPSCRRQQIVAADNHVNTLTQIVHDNSKLIRPLRMPVAHEDIAALT